MEGDTRRQGKGQDQRLNLSPGCLLPDWQPQRVGLPGTEDPLASYLTGLEIFKGMTESAWFI